jgi:hypothetical protein
VLFIGNSLTSTYDIPGMVQALAASAGDSLICNSRTISGSALSNRLDLADLGAIDSGGYDFVVLQEQSSRPTIPADRGNLMYPAVRTLNSNIVSSGARTVLYQTWAYPAGDPQNCGSYDTPAPFNECGFLGMTAALRWGYAGIANELGVAISPVGMAWLTVESEQPQTNLYQPADYHPNTNGAYLAACVHYASLTGRSPVGNPHIGPLTNSSVASYLQNVAERTVLGDPWAMDPYGFASNRFCWAYSWNSFSSGVALPGTSAMSAPPMIISGTAGATSPSVLLNTNAGLINQISLGVYEPESNAAGQGRLFVRDGGNIEAGTLVVGKEGKGWVRQDGGSVVVDGELILGEEPSSAGSYTLTDGELTVSQVSCGAGGAAFAFEGGNLAFQNFGQTDMPLDLVQDGGVLIVTNQALISGNYTINRGAQLAVTLGKSNCLTVTGQARLAGTLAVSLAPGFSPATGQTFTILSAGSIVGEWDRTDGPWLLAGGLRLVVLKQGVQIVAMVVDGTADSDGNGLPDWWKLQYFGSLTSGQSWTNSFLKDGIPNGVKFALDIDPTVPINPNSFAQPGSSNNYPTLTYRQLAGGTGTIGVDYTAMNITYTVEFKDNLISGQWQSGTNVVRQAGAQIPNNDGTETVTVQAQTPISTPQVKLLRLMIKHSN